MQVRRHHRIDAAGLAHHPHGHRIDQFLVPGHALVAMRHQTGDLVPEYHPGRCAFDFVTTVRCFLGPDRAISNAIAHDPLHPAPREDRRLGGHFLRQSARVRPPWPAYSPSEFSRTITQSRSPTPTSRSGEVTPGRIRVGRTLAD